MTWMWVWAGPGVRFSGLIGFGKIVITRFDSRLFVVFLFSVIQ